MMQGPGVVTRKPRFSKGDFHRYSRLVHGWLSAFAFLLLCFFAFTGLLLNHPDWLKGKAPAPIETKFKLDAEEMERVRYAAEPAEELALVAATKVAVRGTYTGGNQVGKEVFARLQGVRGLTDLRASLVTGSVEVVIEPAPTTSILNELHRAEHAGNAWRLAVDAIAILLILLSIVGYLIFLSMRFRLRTALILTIASAAGVWCIFAIAVT